MEIHLDGHGLEKINLVLNSFGPKGEAAVTRALNRALDGVKTDISMEMRKRYQGVKAGDIKKTFSVTRASKSNLIGMARSKGAGQRLYLFGARPSKPGGRKPPIGASVQVSSTRKRIKGAFVAKMRSGHIGLFARTGEYGRNGWPFDERIRELFTFAIPQAAAWFEEHQEVVSKGVRERFVKALDNEMDRAMNALGARFG